MAKSHFLKEYTKEVEKKTHYLTDEGIPLKEAKANAKALTALYIKRLLKSSVPYENAKGKLLKLQAKFHTLALARITDAVIADNYKLLKPHWDSNKEACTVFKIRYDEAERYYRSGLRKLKNPRNAKELKIYKDSERY